MAVPLMGSAAPGAAMGEGQPPASGGDQARGQLEALMGQIRTFGQQLEQFGQTMPALAPEVQQMRQILKRMVVKAAQSAPQQTASSQNLPG